MTYRLPDRLTMKRAYRRYLEGAYEPRSRRKDALRLLIHLGRVASAGDRTVWQQLSDHQDGTLTGVLIKKALRSYLLTEQGHRCCYCQRWLMHIAHACPIEHVLPRSAYPQFTVQFWNLALACYDCNQLKKTAVWGSHARTRLDYLQPAQALDFFHPRYHHFDEHVRFFRIETNHACFTAFSGITEQGKHLCTELLYKVAGKETLCRSTPALAGLFATLEAFQGPGEVLQRPELDAFRAELDTAIIDRLNDGARTQLL